MSDRAAVRGVLVPLGLLFAAVLLWTRASFDQSLGPLDFGTASWLIAALWVGAPVVGGLLSAGSGSPEVPRAAAVLGLVVGLLVALVVFFGPRTAVLTTECARLAGALPPLVVGALAVGAIVGFGMAAAEVVTAALTRRGLWFAGVPVGAAVNFAAGAAALRLLYSVVVCM